MRSTGPTRDVLKAIYLAPGGTFGADIMKRTGLRGGTVYPILYRLERDGWLRAWWSYHPDIRARRFYDLTEKGLNCMREWGLM